MYESYLVRPGVNADLMPGHVFLNKDSRTLNDPGTDNEEGRMHVLLG
jgi:hypothetical protein